MPMLTVKMPTAGKGADAGLYRRTCRPNMAAMREAVKRLGGDTAKVNPLSPVGLVIDHSVTMSIVLVMMRHLKKTYAWKWSATTNVMCS
ncbi:hypothetical protein ACLK1T_29315 [Escherichia coli]